MIDSFFSWLFKWQVLAGSSLGPFFAFYLSIKYQANKERKIAVRKVETSLTKSLNDIYKTREQFKEFIKRLKETVLRAKDLDDENTFFIEENSFPAVRDVFADDSLATEKFGSYYLHNKLLWINAGIKDTNSFTQELRAGYEKLLERNLFIVKQEKVRRQREMYIQNLENFITAVQSRVDFLDEGIKILTQAKLYNLKLFGWKRILVLLKYEGTSFKYFKTNKTRLRYSQHLDSLDRIDKVIEPEVSASIIEAEKRSPHKK